ELKTKADKAKTESKSALLKQIDELSVKKEMVRDKLKQLQAAGNGSWDDMKAGVEKSWGELKGAFSKASTRFK
ncbi:MAG TPA: coiled coil domain-containing protein, partial [bacterium]